MPISIKFYLFRQNVMKWTLRILLLITLALLLFLISSNVSFALGWDPVGDAIKGIQNTIKQWLAEAINDSMKNSFQLMLKMYESINLTNNFKQLFGGGSPLTIVNDIAGVTVKPVAATVLSFVGLIQLIKITSRANQSDTIPMVQEIFTLVITIAAFSYFVNHALEIVQTLYNVCAYLTKSVLDNGIGSLTSQDIDLIKPNADGNYGDYSFGMLFGLLIATGLSYIGALIACILIMAVVYSRAVQTYIMAAFSPLAFSLFGIDETRGWATGYIKNFVALGLANAVLAFTLVLYPFVMTAVIGSTDFGSSLETIDPVNGTMVNTLLVIAKFLALSAIVGLAALKSGQIAKDILGG